MEKVNIKDFISEITARFKQLVENKNKNPDEYILEVKSLYYLLTKFGYEKEGKFIRKVLTVKHSHIEPREIEEIMKILIDSIQKREEKLGKILDVCGRFCEEEEE